MYSNVHAHLHYTMYLPTLIHACTYSQEYRMSTSEEVSSPEVVATDDQVPLTTTGRIIPGNLLCNNNDLFYYYINFQVIGFN